MIWRSGSIRWLPSCTSCDWLVRGSSLRLSRLIVSRSSAALMSDCLATNQQGLPAELSANAHFWQRIETRQMPAIGATGTVLLDISGTSFPELAHVDLRVRSFRSQSDYFRTRFSLSRFLLLMPMRYFVDVNPALFQEQAPSDGVCAILAHELVHVVSLSRGNRIRRLGLVRLLSKRTDCTKFERRADLEAIHRGYGDRP